MDLAWIDLRTGHAAAAHDRLSTMRESSTAKGFRLLEHERRPLAREIARTLLELGVLQRRAKRKRAAKQTLDQALATLTRMDARIWQERAGDEIPRKRRRKITTRPKRGAQTPSDRRHVSFVTRERHLCVHPRPDSRCRLRSS
jgi:hypothetical protein